MSEHINALLKNMANVAADIVGDGANEASKEALRVFENNKASLAELVEAKVNGQLSEKDFEAELSRAKVIVEIELISLEIAAKATVQNAMNAAMAVLKNAL